MGLTKPAGSEARSVTPLNTNSDLLDKFAPCILVNDGVTPPTGDLYDGALVKERTSGIIWEARKNGGGTFDKVYVRYPLHFQGTASATYPVSSSAGVWANMPIDAVNAAYCKNSSAAQIVGARFSAPVKGIYQFTMRLAFVSNGTGERAIGYEANGVTVTGEEYINSIVASSSGGQPLKLTIITSTLLGVGDTAGVSGWQNSGGNLNATFIGIKAAMIEPIQ